MPHLKPAGNLVNPQASLRARIKAYRRRAVDVQRYLAAHPQEWGRFQSEFNQEVNGVFRDIMAFVKDHLARGEEERVYKLKRFFTIRLVAI